MSRELRLENLVAHSGNFIQGLFLVWNCTCSLKMIKNAFFTLHGLGIRLKVIIPPSVKETKGHFYECVHRYLLHKQKNP